MEKNNSKDKKNSMFGNALLAFAVSALLMSVFIYLLGIFDSPQLTTKEKLNKWKTYSKDLKNSEYRNHLRASLSMTLQIESIDEQFLDSLIEDAEFVQVNGPVCIICPMSDEDKSKEYSGMRPEKNINDTCIAVLVGNVYALVSMLDHTVILGSRPKDPPVRHTKIKVSYKNPLYMRRVFLFSFSEWLWLELS